MDECDESLRRSDVFLSPSEGNESEMQTSGVEYYEDGDVSHRLFQVLTARQNQNKHARRALEDGYARRIKEKIIAQLPPVFRSAFHAHKETLEKLADLKLTDADFLAPLELYKEVVNSDDCMPVYDETRQEEPESPNKRRKTEACAPATPTHSSTSSPPCHSSSSPGGSSHSSSSSYDSPHLDSRLSVAVGWGDEK